MKARRDDSVRSIARRRYPLAVGVPGHDAPTGAVLTIHPYMLFVMERAPGGNVLQDVSLATEYVSLARASRAAETGHIVRKYEEVIVGEVAT